MSIGERIKNLRKNNKITQEKLAEELGVARPTVSSWENNENKPTAENLSLLAVILNTSASYLLGETNHPAVGHGLLIEGIPIPEPTRKSKEETRLLQNARLNSNINNKGLLFIKNTPSLISTDHAQNFEQVISVPVFERAYSACCGSGFPNADQIYCCAEEFIEMPISFIGHISTDLDKRPFMIYAEGDSMIQAGITDGSQLLVNPGEDIYDGDSALVEYGHSKNIAVKRIYWLNGSGIEIRSASGETWKRTFTLQEQQEDLLRIIGKVVWYGNKPKRG